MFWERFYNMCVLKKTKPSPVAKKIGISSGIITKWKTSGTLPNGETLIRIADYLDCSVDYLLGRTDNPEINIGISRSDFANNENSSDVICNSIVTLYDQLDDDNRKYLQGYIHRLLEEQEKDIDINNK